MFPETWQPQDLGTMPQDLGTMEVPLPNGMDPQSFEVLKTTDALVFGGSTNAGFLQSGYMRLEEGESENEALQELFEDLYVFYADGPSYVSRIVINERM